MSEPNGKGISVAPSSFARFYHGKFVDLRIECEGFTFLAHKVILANYSIVFEKMLSGDWKEANEGVIQLAEAKVAVVDAMVYFVYHLHYDDGKHMASRPDELIFHAQVYSFAETYDMESLKDYARSRFQTALEKDGCRSDVFFCVVDEVYNATPVMDRTLRDILVKVSEKNAEYLITRDDFRTSIAKATDFMTDLFHGLASFGPIAALFYPRTTTSDKAEYQCPQCSATGFIVFSSNTTPDSKPIYCDDCGCWMESKSECLGIGLPLLQHGFR
jgi:hypothetical protein